MVYEIDAGQLWINARVFEFAQDREPAIQAFEAKMLSGLRGVTRGLGDLWRHEKWRIEMKVRDAVIAKLRDFWHSGVDFEPFSVVENREVERMIANGELNRDSFIRLGVFYEPKPSKYPFSKALDEELSKGWYERFREGIAVKIIRDVMGLAAFLASLYLMSRQIFGQP